MHRPPNGAKDGTSWTVMCDMAPPEAEDGAGPGQLEPALPGQNAGLEVGFGVASGRAALGNAVADADMGERSRCRLLRVRDSHGCRSADR